ncbi:MAG TPA: hypothetical protein VJL29_13065 [Thermoguttaceae bacterium]|nr:hypothetical protein [Thermoguttaceae bacterium]
MSRKMKTLPWTLCWIVVGALGGVALGVEPADTKEKPKIAAAPDAKDVRAEAEVEWNESDSSDATRKELLITILLHGPAAAGASGYSEPKIESILDDRGQPIFAIKPIDRGDEMFPRNSIDINLGNFSSEPTKKLKELRGSVDLRTGGRMESVTLPKAIKRLNGIFDDKSLKKLGLSVQVTKIKPAEKPSYDFPFSKGIGPGKGKDDRWHVAIDWKESPVVGCEIVDSRGKLLNAYMSSWSCNDNHMDKELAYKKKLPEDAQLRLIVHVDSRIVRMPFALRDVPVPPRRKRDQEVVAVATPVVAPSKPGLVNEVPVDDVPMRRASVAGAISHEVSVASRVFRVVAPNLSAASAVVKVLGTMGQGVPLATNDGKPAKKPRGPKELYVDRKSGNCELKPSGDPEGPFEVEVGRKLKGTCQFRLSDFLGREIINAQVNLRNYSEQTMHCQYYVAFFDKDRNLLGCDSQGADLAVGDETTLGSCLIPLPEGVREKAVSYQVVYYESDVPIGTPGGKKADIQGQDAKKTATFGH